MTPATATAKSLNLPTSLIPTLIPTTTTTTTSSETTPGPTLQSLDLDISTQDLPPATLHNLITSSPRGTPFEKSVWLLLVQIPRGHFTTYKHMADHLRSSPRAVGNALRRNPYAPAVPCHRVVATGGLLGGFKGKSLRRDGEGITLDEKRMLLRREGVRFDAKVGNGGVRVMGTPFTRFI
ncbi:6-O-methylguanine DNA methyltransferase [Cercophora scortea]|uniref:Methylated-DNA--protein-cysteine methyltransferase n=1 Tax=Cercophora scortea TaxID=314031 RepID=A0AAE0M7E5_9PEZI|nr:6-O-methylguanine DNA methyltransferase [Cercophora scortea]